MCRLDDCHTGCRHTFGSYQPEIGTACRAPERFGLLAMAGLGRHPVLRPDGRELSIQGDQIWNPVIAMWWAENRDRTARTDGS